MRVWVCVCVCMRVCVCVCNLAILHSYVSWRSRLIDALADVIIVQCKCAHIIIFAELTADHYIRWTDCCRHWTTTHVWCRVGKPSPIMKHQPENFGPPSPSHPFLVFLFLPIFLVVYLVVVVLTLFGPMHFCGVCVHSGYVWVGGQASAIIIVPTWVAPFLSTVPAFFLMTSRSPFIHQFIHQFIKVRGSSIVQPPEALVHVAEG